MPPVFGGDFGLTAWEKCGKIKRTMPLWWNR